MAQSKRCAELLAECVGTFLLVFTVGCNVLGGNAIFGPVSIASVLMVSIYCLGGVSGANFNPAVSIALWIINLMGAKGGIGFSKMALYVLVQLAGGVIASICYVVMFAEGFDLGPANGFGSKEVAVVEILYTFMLCFVVLNVACATKREKNQYYGLAIGFVIVAGAYGAGAVSGGCFNPAVALAIDVSSEHMGRGPWCPVYAAAEVLGAVLAALAFRLVRPEEFDDEEFDEDNEERSDRATMISEFLGTAMLVATVGLNVLGSSPAGAYSIAASLMCMIYALGDVSGAHFNPAVTWAVSCTRLDPHLNTMEAAKYVLAQTAGGLAGAGLYRGVYSGQTFDLPAPDGLRKHLAHVSDPYSRLFIDWAKVAFAETIFTFVLCYAVLAVAVVRTTKTPHFFGLAIGSCVTAGGLAIGRISGGCLNPAVSVGVAAVHALSAGPGVLVKAALYTIFELIGGFLAFGMLRYTHAIDFVDDDSYSSARSTGRSLKASP